MEKGKTDRCSELLRPTKILIEMFQRAKQKTPEMRCWSATFLSGKGDTEEFWRELLGDDCISELCDVAGSANDDPNAAFEVTTYTITGEDVTAKDWRRVADVCVSAVKSLSMCSEPKTRRSISDYLGMMAAVQAYVKNTNIDPSELIHSVPAWFEFVFNMASEVGCPIRVLRGHITRGRFEGTPYRHIDHDICEASVLALEFLQNAAKGKVSQRPAGTEQETKAKGKKITAYLNSPRAQLIMALDNFAEATMLELDRLEPVFNSYMSPDDPEYEKQMLSHRKRFTQEHSTPDPLLSPFPLELAKTVLSEKLKTAQRWLYQCMGPKVCRQFTQNIEKAVNEIQENLFKAFPLLGGLRRFDYSVEQLMALFEHKDSYKTSINNNLQIIHDSTHILREIDAKPVVTCQEKEISNRGRPPEHTDDELKRMQKARDEIYADTNDSKAAWNKVATLYGKKSGDAVRVACMKLKKSK